MADRMTSLDASFLYMEQSTTVMHVGSVMVFAPTTTRFNYQRVVDLIGQRIVRLPRYRQKIRYVPANLANPVWVDDENFDLSYHVRRAALPKPGNDAQLEDFVSRVQPRRLDRNRPLWEVYLVEGLEHGRFAIVTKTHQAMIDGVNALDIGHILVTDQPSWDDGTVDLWEPQNCPNDLQLVTEALFDGVRAPGQLVGAVRGGVTDVASLGGKLIGGVGSLVSTVARGAARPAPTSPLNADVGRSRRFIMVGTDLDDYRAVRNRLARGITAEEVSIHDVILATIAGAMRAWLLMRGEAVQSGTVVRALVPVSISDGKTTGLDQLVACVVDLPVGEPAAGMRLHQIAYIMRQQIEGSGRAVEANNLVGLAGFAPPTLHAMGARLGSAMSRRLFNVIVTNVPGPQNTLYAGDAAMLSTYPVIPLAKGQALAIGLTSYDGGVYYGLNADRDAMPDVDVVGQSIVDSLAELVGSR